MNEEEQELIESLTEYYSEQTGQPIDFGYDGEMFWVSGPRLKEHEKFEYSEDAEDRVKLLYPEIFTDELEDPFGRLGI